MLDVTSEFFRVLPNSPGGDKALADHRCAVPSFQFFAISCSFLEKSGQSNRLAFSPLGLTPPPWKILDPLLRYYREWCRLISDVGPTMVSAYGILFVWNKFFKQMMTDLRGEEWLQHLGRCVPPHGVWSDWSTVLYRDQGQVWDHYAGVLRLPEGILPRQQNPLLQVRFTNQYNLYNIMYTQMSTNGPFWNLQRIRKK